MSHLSVASSRLADIPNMFGEISEANIVFCVDVSGSMYRGLPAIKRHLAEALAVLSSYQSPRQFDIVHFADRVHVWCEQLAPLNPANQEVAVEYNIVCLCVSLFILTRRIGFFILF